MAVDRLDEHFSSRLPRIAAAALSAVDADARLGFAEANNITP
jgi:hypothetical protein